MQDRAAAASVESDDRTACSSDSSAVRRPKPRRRHLVAVPSQKSECPFDLERLGSACGDQDSRMLALLEMFGRETGADLAALGAAFKSQDAVQIARLSHRLKGSAALLGAECLRRQAATMESRGRRADLTGAHACFKGLIEEFDRCRDFIDAFRKSLSR